MAIDKFIDFFINYISKLDESMPVLLVSSAKYDQLAFLTNKESSIIKIMYDLVEVFLNLIGTQNHTNQLYKVNNS